MRAVLVCLVAASLCACGSPSAPVGGPVGGSTSAATMTPTKGSSRVMSENRFWEIVDATVDADLGVQAEQLGAQLVALTPEEITAFDRRFVQVSNAIATEQHLGAAEVIMGFTSQDVFVSFRTWVVYRGRSVYEGFRTRPDSLASHGPTGDEQIGMAEILEFAPLDAFDALGHVPPEPDPDEASVYIEPTGPEIDHDYSALAARYPALAAAYLPSPAPVGTPFANGPRSISRR